MRCWGLVGIVAVALAASGGCGDGAKTGVVRVATEAGYRPFEFEDEQGKLTGFDMDLIRAVGKAAGLDVQISHQPWDGIFAGLGKRYEIVISAVTITEERKQNILFSDPYLDAGLIIAVRAETEGVTTLDHLVGKTIAVQANTTGAKKAEEITDATVVPFESIELALKDLAAGRADAVINDEPSTRFYAKNMEGLKMVGSMLTDEKYGIAMAKGNDALAAKVNAALKQLRDSGEYDQIKARWLGKS